MLSPQVLQGMKGSVVTALLLSLTLAAQAQRNQPPLPEPTFANVAYGDHPRQVMDFWQAEVGNRGPLVVYIHGGGFRGGSKDSVGAARVKAFTEKGIHVAAVEYRLLADAKLPAAHEDAVRAIQFIRQQARDWKVDSRRIGAFGGSAGAQLVAYLAWHDNFADPDSEDPVVRQSSRLAAVALSGGQATMNQDWWMDNIPGYDEPHRPITDYIDLTGIARDALIEEISIINHISPDDPPVFMRYGMKPDDQIPEENPQGWKVHHVNFGIAMDYALRRAGVETTLKYPGPVTRYEDEVEFFIDKLLWQGHRERFTDFEAATYQGSNGQELHYQVLRPHDYDPDKQYPLVLFLHGSGGRGAANIMNLVDASIPARLASEEVYGQYNAFYLVPQCPGPNAWSKGDWYANRYSRPRPTVQDTLYELVDTLIADNNIDTRRLYITGLSMGGFGTFSAVSARPDFWAAAAPVCGGWDPEAATRLKGTPFRVYHGDQDQSVDVNLSRTMVAALEAAGADVAYTEYPGVGHNSWLNAYWEPALWEWMFAQRR